MSTLIFKATAYFLRSKTIFPPSIEIYDDFMKYRNTHWFFWHDEITVTYNHIAQVNIRKGIFFGDIELVNTGGVENIIVKHLFRWDAVKAKAIIEQKLYAAHQKPNRKTTKKTTSDKIHELEHGISRLRELQHRGRISRGEYNKRRKKLLEGH